jgi:hypothetical protein
VRRGGVPGTLGPGLWHQTAFLAVTLAYLVIGRLPGLHPAPSSALWVVELLAWLPAFAAALAASWLAFHRAERAPRLSPVTLACYSGFAWAQNAVRVEHALELAVESRQRVIIKIEEIGNQIHIWCSGPVCHPPPFRGLDNEVTN